MKMRPIRWLTIAAALCVSTACAPLLDLAGPSLFNLAGKQSCEPARAGDPAAPGEWICPTSTGDRARPRHRVVDPQD
jgi:hypothetical protein